MRTLRSGFTGDDVTSWQTFLRGLSPASQVVVNGMFDSITKEETIKFQSSFGLTPDGVVGPFTFGKALGLGYSAIQDDDPDKTGPNWPPVPGVTPLSYTERLDVFGKFSYVPAPVPGNPEAIRITDNWASQNIVTVNLPQLSKVGPTNVQFNSAAAHQLKTLFTDWESAGLLDRIITWGGSWVPRFVRGSRTHLSNHAWGTAFDINVAWNMLGTTPALVGKKGSVRELVEIANSNGFYWGGHFKGRPDGMHFEISNLKLRLCAWVDTY